MDIVSLPEFKSQIGKVKFPLKVDEEVKSTFLEPNANQKVEHCKGNAESITKKVIVDPMNLSNLDVGLVEN